MIDFPTITSRTQWGCVFTDPAVWRPMIEHICQTHRLGVVQTIAPGYPGSNAVFLVNDMLVVKISAPFWREEFDRERELYRLLTSYPALLTPALLASGIVEGSQDWPYLVMERRPGHRLGDVWGAVPMNNRIAIAERAGRLVRLLHDVPLTGITSMDTSRAAWDRFIERQTAGCVEHHRKTLPPHLLDQIPSCLADATPLFPDHEVPYLLHCDLTNDHLLLSQCGGQWEITGLIDFGDTEVGHHEYEFVAVGLNLFATHPHSRMPYLSVFLKSYGRANTQDRRFSRRMMAYSLLHRSSDLQPFIEQMGGPDRVHSLDQIRGELWGIL